MCVLWFVWFVWKEYQAILHRIAESQQVHEEILYQLHVVTREVAQLRDDLQDQANDVHNDQDADWWKNA